MKATREELLHFINHNVIDKLNSVIWDMPESYRTKRLPELVSELINEAIEITEREDQ